MLKFVGAGSQILVGTTKNCVLAGTMELSFREVVVGHADEVISRVPRVLAEVCRNFGRF